jgi:hypothetical protein
MTWDTKCTYQHQFRYTPTNVSSKNKPCRNLPLKCELCHPVLPPAPSKTTRKRPIVSVSTVWHYNMHEHILQEHKEYVVLGQRDAGLALPVSVWKEMKITDLEQTTSRIPKTRWQPSYTPPDKIGKENIPLLISHSSKCSAAQAGPSRPSKKAQTIATALSAPGA